MKVYIVALSIFVFIVCVAAAKPNEKPDAKPEEKSNEWLKVENAFGVKGNLEDGIFEVKFPRTDLDVALQNIPLHTGFAVTSEVDFQMHENKALMIGELALVNSEVEGVLKKMGDNGITVTAIHNHLMNENPPIMWIHFMGDGDPVVLAEKFRDVLTATATPMAIDLSAHIQGAQTNWSVVENVMGMKGETGDDGVFHLAIPRADKIRMNGIELLPGMGAQVEIDMEMLDTKAAVTGELALLASEVNPVISALRDNNIAVTALHSHTLAEEPRLFYVHFFGYDTPKNLARELLPALAKIHLEKPKGALVEKYEV
jgi:hypothetical protein